MPVLVLHYRRADNATFDFDYYIGKHMELAGRIWGPFLERAEVLKGIASAVPGQDAEFDAITLLHFRSEADMQAALRHPDAAKLHADVANFATAPASGQICTVIYP